jgi:hypothetical protein
MGFAKAYGFGQISALTKAISKPMGLLWLLAGLLFIASCFLYFSNKEIWPVLSIAAVVLSQILIITVWKDAKFGTLANVIIMAAAIIGLANTLFENGYKKDVLSAMENNGTGSELISQEDIDHLPPAVQKYLDYVGVVGKPKVYNFKIVFEGEMRDKGKDWFKFISEQYNFFEHPARMFFMKAKVKGLPTYAYHAYKEGEAGMQVKILSLFPVVDIKGKEMFPTETVTYFNDLCLFAPAALIDDRIIWETLDEFSAKASFTVDQTSISANLYFNKEGQLINFVSNDRHSVSEKKAFPFSTPAKDYRNINGFMLPHYGEAIWHYPDGEFIYGKFYLKSIEYNVGKPE